MTEFHGYTLNGAVHASGDFLLFRAQKAPDRSQVLVKTPVSPHPTRGLREQLEHEYRIGSQLDSAWAVRPLRLEREADSLSLVLEDTDSQPLSTMLGKPMEVSRFLALAINMVGALGEFHRRNLIHKDLKPQNLLVDAKSDVVRLSGFGLTSILPREHQAAVSPERVAGTLAYMSPEQTGRMNRSLDYRTDYYSLGIIFYQMLTGMLPFQTEDPLEWVHFHIARVPRPPAEVVPEIPRPLSDLVMKLLAKVAEERYQSADGLKHDLEICRDQWRSKGRIAPFPLGAHDHTERFQIPQKLYGREKEVAMILEAFERAVEGGPPQVVLVSGYAGIGKTSLVHELYKPIVRERGFFLSGKCDQYKRDIPYFPLAQAFKELAQQLLTENEAQIASWRARLAQALGLNGQLIVDVIPEFELIMGKQAPVVPLPLTEARHRFHTVFRQFLAAFATREHPLALFLDDLQWVDSASLNLIEHLVAHPDTRFLCLLGAYRDNEVSPSHPLALSLAEIRKTPAVVREIVLGPLSLDHLNRLISDTLHCAPAHSRPLAELVFGKTHGNPFFVIQFLTALHQEGLLVFDRGAAAWKWDLESLRTRDLTDNVVALMVGKLKRLQPGTQHVLLLAACIGSKGDLGTLSLINGKNEAETRQDLWEALNEGLVLLQGDHYRFLHDRVQQAAYSIVPEAARTKVHLEIGRLLLTTAAPGEIGDSIFDLVNHLNLGAALIDDPAECKRLAELNLTAGRKAKAATAYKSACQYLGAGVSMLAADAWETEYPLAYALGFERAECDYLRGSFDAALAQLSDLLSHARTVLEKAHIHRLEVDIHTSKTEVEKAIESGIAGLGLLGVELPAHPTPDRVREDYEDVLSQLAGRDIETLLDLPPMTDPMMKAALDILAVMFAPALSVDQNLLLLSYCRMVSISLQHGNTDASALGYTYFGQALGPGFARYQEGFQFGKLGYDLMEQGGLIAYKARINFIFGDTVLPWTRPLWTGLRYLDVAFQTAVESGDLTTACYCCNHLVVDRLVLGESLDAVYLEAENRLDFTRKANFDASSQVIVGIQRLVQNMRGLTRDFSTFDGPGFDEAGYEAFMDRYGWGIVPCWYYIMKLQARFMSGDHAAALAAARKAQPLIGTSFAHIQEPEFWYYHALALAACFPAADPEARRASLETLAACQGKLGEWAASSPSNFHAKHALVSAEIARIKGEDLEAMRLYEVAIRSAREHGFIQNEGVGYEVAARYYQDRGFETFAHAYLQEARSCFVRWRADGKVRQLDRQYPFLVSRRAASNESLVAFPDHLDSMTVYKALQAISREIMLPRLLETLLRIVIENAGAQKGYLILVRHDDLRIETEARADERNVQVVSAQPVSAAAVLPGSLLAYVKRTRDKVILDDARDPNMFMADAYLAKHQPRSVLCLPIIRKAELIGMLYLENNLVPGAFSPDRIQVLELLAAQAAIALENATLYTELQQENADRSRAEAALRESEERLRAIVDNSTALVYLKDVEGRYLLVNKRFETLFQVSQSDITGKTDFDLFPRSVAEAFQQNDRKVLDTRTLLEFEEEAMQDDGLHTYLSVKFPVLDAQGVPYALGGISTDITERKKATEEVARRTAELEQAKELDRLKTTFINAVSHDLRTPLTSIVGYSEFLEDEIEGPLTSQQREFVLQIEKSTKRLQRLVDDLLDFARMDAGTFKLRLEEADLGQKIADLVATMQPQAQAAKLKLSYELPAEPLVLVMDAQRVDRVIINLLTNAIKFTPPGGRVAVRAWQEEDQVRCEVADTGIGIAPGDLPKLFNRFSQLAGGAAKGGTGLGLSICKAIVDAHGGEIGVVSDPDRGSTFWFTLPARREG